MPLESIISIHAHHILDRFCRDTTTNKSCRRYPFFESACGITQSWIIQALPQSPQLLLHHALLLAGPAQPQTWLQVPGRTDMGQWKYNMHPWAELENIRNNLEVHVFCLLMCDIYTLHEILCKWLGPFKTPACFRRLVLLHQSLNLRFQLLSCL